MSICMIIVVLCSSLHERLCWVFRTPASHSGVFSLLSRPWHSWLSDLLRISITLPRKFVGCILKTSSTASFHFLYKSTYTERKKNAGPNQRKVNTEEKNLYEHRPSAAWFPSSRLLMIKENVQSVHLEFPCRYGRRETSGTHVFYHVWRGLFTTISYEIPSRIVWKCGSAHSNSYMVHAW
jgi:hypothetical protein